MTVFVRGGTYSLPQTLKLEAQDSGTPASPVTYQAYEDETPVVIGGKPISGFEPYRGKILKADVATQGLQGVEFRQLFCNGRRMHLARYPNFDPQNPYGGGWAYADGKPVPMYADVPGEDKRTLHYKSSDARNWARPEEGEVFVFPRYNWWNNIVPHQEHRPREAARHTGRRLLLRHPPDGPVLRPRHAGGAGRAGRMVFGSSARGRSTSFRQQDADPATMDVSAPHLRTIVDLEAGATPTSRSAGSRSSAARARPSCSGTRRTA